MCIRDRSKVVKQFGGKDIGMTITRDGNDIEASITPRKDPPKGQGALGVVISNYTIKKYSYTEAPVYGLIESAKITGIIAKELGKTLVRFVTFQKRCV